MTEQCRGGTAALRPCNPAHKKRREKDNVLAVIVFLSSFERKEFPVIKDRL